jgi:hypothetical protein
LYFEVAAFQKSIIGTAVAEDMLEGLARPGKFVSQYRQAYSTVTLTGMST